MRYGSGKAGEGVVGGRVRGYVRGGVFERWMTFLVRIGGGIESDFKDSCGEDNGLPSKGLMP